MSKPQIHNVMKVADMREDQISKACLAVIKNSIPEYTDNTDTLGEHLFNIDTVIEQENHDDEVIRELHEIWRAMSKKGCAYLRVVID